MLQRRIERELTEIAAAGLTRHVTDLQFRTATQACARDGREYIVFSSNNYLGLTHDPRVQQAAARAAQQGTGSTGSRLTTGGVFAATELERELAAFKHAESALIFNTGYMTNLGVLYGLRGRRTLFSATSSTMPASSTVAVSARHRWSCTSITICRSWRRGWHNTRQPLRRQKVRYLL